VADETYTNAMADYAGWGVAGERLFLPNFLGTDLAPRPA
jgi:hypothetical protein